MSPIGRRHRAGVDRLTRMFTGGLGDRAIVRVQSSVVLGNRNEPEPDLALPRPRADFYADADETPNDVLLIVEVADSSLEYDLRIKTPMYARHGIPELWIADLNHDQILLFRDPTPHGYTTSESFGAANRSARSPSRVSQSPWTPFSANGNARAAPDAPPREGQLTPAHPASLLAWPS